MVKKSFDWAKVFLGETTTESGKFLKHERLARNITENGNIDILPGSFVNKLPELSYRSNFL